MKDKLKLLRLEKKMTVRELSASSGVSISYINQIESGKRTEVSNKIINKLAAAFNVYPDYLKESISDSYLHFRAIDNLASSPACHLYLDIIQRALDYGINPETVNTIINMLIKIKENK